MPGEGSWLSGLGGIVPSLNTPFTEDDGIDRESLRRLVDHLVASGCPGFLALAVASESAALSEDEWTEVAETLLARGAGRLRAIVSVTADRQEVRLRRAAKARGLGADAILCQVPLCQAPGGRGAEARRDLLGEVAAAGPEVLMIQDLDWHGPGLALEEIVDLFEAIPRFRGLKIETVPAGPKYSAVLAATGGRLHVSGGWAVSQLMDALRRGVHAFMPTEMEPIYVAIHRLYRAGDEAAARRLFESLLPVLAFSNQHIDVSIRFFKMLRKANGLFATDRCRPPVPDFDAVQAREAEILIRRARDLAGGHDSEFATSV